MNKRLQAPSGTVLVGKVTEAHGLKGELFVFLFAKEAPWLNDVKEVTLVNLAGVTQRLTVGKGRLTKDGLILAGKEFTNRNQSEAVIGLGLCVPEEVLLSKPGQTIYLREILHFQVRDSGKVLGVVQGFSSNGPQDLLVVVGPEGQGEIPFVEAFLEKIDFATQTIEMHLPEGLFPQTGAVKDDE